MHRLNLDRRAVLAGAAGLLAAGPAAAKVGVDLPQFKCTEFIRRGAGLTREQFADHWRQVRAPLVRQLPGLKKLAFNLIDEAHSPHASYDGTVELWFDSAAAYDAAFNGVHGDLSEQLIADAKTFMQPDFMGLFTHEVVIRELQAGMAPKVKRMGLVRRRADLSRSAFIKTWRDDHAALANMGYGIQRYVLNIIDRDRMPDCPWDGYAEFWWPDWATVDEGARRPRPPEQLAEKQPFGDTLLLRMVED